MSFLKRFPSYDLLLQNAVEAAKRFTLALLCALSGTGLAVALVDKPSDPTMHVLVKFLLVAFLGLPLFISLSTLGESRSWSRARFWMVQAGGVILLAAYFFSLPPDVSLYYDHLVRFLLLLIGLHFLVAFIPFLQTGQLNGFWQYNKTLFLRILLSALYSAVLYLGLIAALAAADYLFGADVPDDRYFQLWIIIVGVFNTWLFLAGVPRDWKALGSTTSYPVGLKVFTQFILLPLVGLYFVILFAYELKIVFEWNWPKGWVSNMVLWYAVVGILSMLLLHPLREQTENRWIQVFFRWFFRAMVPLAVMLFLAISVRIADYGVTENRYFVFVMAVGLSLVVLYFIFSRTKDIRIIPIVLCLIAFGSTYGPWSAFSVSKHSQRTRLLDYLAAHATGSGSDKDLSDNSDSAVNVLSAQIDDSTGASQDYAEMSSIIRYLSEWHGAEPFRGILEDSLLVGLDTINSNSRSEQVAQHLGFDLTYGEVFTADGRVYFNWRVVSPSPVTVSGYDLLLAFDDQSRITEPHTVLYGDDSLAVSFDSSAASVRVELRHNGQVTRQVMISLPDSLGTKSRPGRQYDRPQAELVFVGQGDGLEAVLIVQHLAGYKREDLMEITALTGQLLLRIQ
jgi:hypothetical protein